MRKLFLTPVMGLLLASVPVDAAQETARPGVDEHTIALWLFDDPSYANVTLTDAGPLQIDLRLETGTKLPVPPGLLAGERGLVRGRFGNALHLPLGDGSGVVWPRGEWLHYGTAPILDRGNEVPNRCNIGDLAWTLELWFKASGEQAGRGTIFELRNESGEALKYCPAGVNSLAIEGGRRGFVLNSRLLTIREWDFELTIPSDATRLNDGEWHHLAFTFTSAERQIRHYVDGRIQPLPEKGGFLPLMGKIISLRVGRDGDGGQEISGVLDELRLSDALRYSGDFTPPQSFSASHHNPAGPSKPDGPPLLFPANTTRYPVDLGSRKHVFIDEVLIERKKDVHLTVNPPVSFQATDFGNDQSWEATPRFGSAIPDIASFWDDGDEVRMLYTNGGMWGGKPHAVALANSRDGLHWTKPKLGLFELDGSRDNNIVLRNASQGTAFKDPNPDVRPEHLYKYMAWCLDRGSYIFTSPDGIHWRKNESMALPFDPDGSVSVFWDDQAGVYRAFLRALIPGKVATGTRTLRQIVRAQTNEVLKPWPFQPSPNPLWHADFSLPKPASGELPPIDTGGQVYRFKGIKYPWAPDVYLAFPWRYIYEDNVRPGSFLMVSRDGENWTRYEPPYYFSPGFEFEGREVLEALMEQGMVRRGYQIWQYGTVRFTEHGGALYGGQEHEGGYYDRLLRLVQRLDGFVSLDAGPEGGTVVTKPLRFEGTRLTLNVAAGGAVRVGFLDESGQPVESLDLENCDPIRADSTHHTVTWRGRADLGHLAGRVVRLEFELKDARLYAMQFVP